MIAVFYAHMHTLFSSPLLSKLWHDEMGVAVAGEVILLTSIVVIGTVAGLTAVRDSIVQEFGDYSLAIENLNQTYTVNCPTCTFGFINDDDGGFGSGGPSDPDGAAPAGIDVCGAATSESG